MIKALFFDFDNTLCSLAETHYVALNTALKELAGPEFLISREEQNSFYNGLSTKVKLNHLVKFKNLPEEKSKEIAKLKQHYTLEAIKQTIEPDLRLKSELEKLCNENYILYCASNAMLETVEAGLEKLGIRHLFDKVIGNDKIERQKPAPDIYLQCCLEAKLDPQECLVIEDSRHGRESAIRSGAQICTVDCPEDVNYDYLKSCMKKPNSTYWIDTKLTVLLPCAGLGSRFKNEGFKLPKPLIDVGGKPMIQKVIESLNIKANYIFLVQKSHCQEFQMKEILNLLVPNCTIIEVNGLTEGAACTTLLAKNYINNSNHLLIANSDQYIKYNSSDFMSYMLTNQVDGGILTFKDPSKNTKWSFVKEENNIVSEVAEKKPISDLASIGIYYFNKGSDYVKYAEQMISKNIRTNNEFYVANVYNEFLNDNKKIMSYQIPIENMYGLGIPSDLEYFLAALKVNKHLG